MQLTSNTSSASGKVEVCVNGIWVTICDDFWRPPDAEVVCQQLSGSNQGQTAILLALYIVSRKTLFIQGFFLRINFVHNLYNFYLPTM